MKKQKLSTASYKGVRDFYPQDMAIQSYIFDTWRKTAESFGYERYDASILEPADLYKSKGAQNEEIINDQSYTFTDRGEREVTLRPEMTPTIARMVSARKRELKTPIRWYSIPNLFRYERPQRGRLREHWQLNCDLLGNNDYISDIEIISLAYQTLIDLGATPEMFEIRINDRALMERTYHALGITNSESINQITRLNDRRHKITKKEYKEKLNDITGNELLSEEIIMILDNTDEQSDVVFGLEQLGINNVIFDKSLARGFDYYTGTVFEIFDKSPENRRSLMGGGRYDNLTQLFSDEAIGGVGFGIGDVSMRDFLETHDLLPKDIHTTAPVLTLIPTDSTVNLEALKTANICRQKGITTAVNFSDRKFGKKITDANERGVKFILPIGSQEIESQIFNLKNLSASSEKTGTLDQLIEVIKSEI